MQGPAPTPVTAGAVKAAVHSYTYCARTTGQYVISATIDGVHMRGSPSGVTASTAEAHAPLCEVRGAPLTLSTVAGAPAGHTFRRGIRTPHLMDHRLDHKHLQLHRKRLCGDCRGNDARNNTQG